MRNVTFTGHSFGEFLNALAAYIRESTDSPAAVDQLKQKRPRLTVTDYAPVRNRETAPQTPQFHRHLRVQVRRGTTSETCFTDSRSGRFREW
mgnify:CR=1 FL=1